MPQTHQRIILVVEDDIYVVSVFQRAFEGQDDFMLDIASTVEQAIAKIRVLCYDLIFLDMKIGHSYAGMEVLRELNRQEITLRAQGHNVGYGLTVIMTASINLHDVMTEAQQLGVVCFIDKPVPMTEEFVRRIVQKLGIPLLPRPRQR